MQYFIDINRRQDKKKGILKSDAQYEKEWHALVDRDEAKVKLFKELRNAGYYLITVDWTIPNRNRASYIWDKFQEQFHKQSKLSQF